MASNNTPPKKRPRASGASGGDEQVPNVQSKKSVTLFSPYGLHWRAYTAYEAEVRGALAAEDLSFIKCKFEAAELKWLGDGKPLDDKLPTKSITISKMSDSIVVPYSCDIFSVPKDDGKTPADLKVMFAEEIVTVASLLDKEFFVGMMCSAGNGRFGQALYSTAMAWVWAMLKLDFDPTGTSALGAGYSKHSREEGWFADQHKKIKLKMLGAMDSTP